jgi:hypothetical protein
VAPPRTSDPRSLSAQTSALGKIRTFVDLLAERLGGDQDCDQGRHQSDTPAPSIKHVGTAGCVGLPEARVQALQDFSQAGALIAVLPETALERFASCLPAASVRAPMLTGGTSHQ